MQKGDFGAEGREGAGAVPLGNCMFSFLKFVGRMI